MMRHLGARQKQEALKALKYIKNLEKLIEHFIEYSIKAEVQKLGLGIISANILRRTSGANLPEYLNLVKRNSVIDYEEFGCHLPDVDIIIYQPQTSKVIAVLSYKMSFQERMAQASYWEAKLFTDKITKHIKVYFITIDEDGALVIKSPYKKGRSIIAMDLDMGYALSESEIEENSKVKVFGHFIDDLKVLLMQKNLNY